MRAMNICKSLPYSFLLFRLHNVRDGSFIGAFPKFVSTLLQRRWMGNGKKTRRCRRERALTFSLSWAAGAWDTTSRSGSSPSTHLSPGTASQGVPAKETLSLNCFQAQIPLPLPQPAIAPQSQSSSSLHTQLPTEGRSRPFTCMPRLQKKGYKFPF